MAIAVSLGTPPLPARETQDAPRLKEEEQAIAEGDNVLAGNTSFLKGGRLVDVHGVQAVRARFKADALSRCADLLLT